MVGAAELLLATGSAAASTTLLADGVRGVAGVAHLLFSSRLSRTSATPELAPLATGTTAYLMEVGAGVTFFVFVPALEVTPDGPGGGKLVEEPLEIGCACSGGGGVMRRSRMEGDITQVTSSVFVSHAVVVGPLADACCFRSLTYLDI